MEGGWGEKGNPMVCSRETQPAHSPALSHSCPPPSPLFPSHTHRLTSVYGLLRKMRFFRHFLLCRSFRRWRANVKRAAFERTRAVVAERLFAVSATFQPAVLLAGRLVVAGLVVGLLESAATRFRRFTSTATVSPPLRPPRSPPPATLLFFPFILTVPALPVVTTW